MEPEPVELETIQAFKHALDHLSEEEDLDSDREILTTNYGNKLKRTARFVSSRSIAIPNEMIGVQIVDYNGHKRPVMTRRRSVSPPSDSEEEAGALDDIDLNSILKPAEDPADIPKHKAIAHTFESTYLADMARETLDIIVEEKAHATKVSNLLSAFLGDDPESLNLHKLGVKPYSGNAEQDAETFFAPPETPVDNNYGVSSETAEEARQLLQIAHQRLEEFVQCMTDIRSGFTHANRKRRQVYNWCKELNDQDYIEEEIGPEVPVQTWAPAQALEYKTHASATATERSE